MEYRDLFIRITGIVVVLLGFILILKGTTSNNYNEIPDRKICLIIIGSILMLIGIIMAGIGYVT